MTAGAKRKNRVDPRDIRSTAELAKYLGLARWTVSRALNGHPGIAPATRERVREAMAHFQFAPSPIARALRGGRTGTVGICLQEPEKFNLTSRITTLHRRLREMGFHALFEFSDGQPETEAEIFQHFLAMQVEGVAIFSGLLSRQSTAFNTLRRASIPVVQVDSNLPPFPGTVWIDRGAAIRLVMQHLFKLGHRHFATLGIDPASYYGGVRDRALRECLASPQAPRGTRLVQLFELGAPRMDFEYGRRLAERLLAEPKPPTALVALNDHIAFGAIEFLKGRNFRVPHDFSATGFDNSDLSAFANPPLTTVDAQVDLMIDHALKLLLQNIERKGGKPPTHRIEPRLIVRASTAPPRSG